MHSDLPLPPLELALRAGGIEGSVEERFERYDWIGASLRQAIMTSLPEGWNWAGRAALDFGCGAGRVLRHFAREAALSEIWGCDIHEPSIAWLQANLQPPFKPFLVSEEPGLPHEDEYFDVVWALSVFTHLTENWAGWLAEMHRVLKTGGYLVSTFMGASMKVDAQGEWDENRIGMQVLGFGRPWEEGGPSVFHSEWWLRAHWGRIFEVVKVERNEDQSGMHGLIVLRKLSARAGSQQLEAAESEEPRELRAMQSNVAALQRENKALRRRIFQLEAEVSRRWTTRAAARLRGMRRVT